MRRTVFLTVITVLAVVGMIGASKAIADTPDWPERAVARAADPSPDWAERAALRGGPTGGNRVFSFFPDSPHASILTSSGGRN